MRRCARCRPVSRRSGGARRVPRDDGCWEDACAESAAAAARAVAENIARDVVRATVDGCAPLPRCRRARCARTAPRVRTLLSPLARYPVAATARWHRAGRRLLLQHGRRVGYEEARRVEQHGRGGQRETRRRDAPAVHAVGPRGQAHEVVVGRGGVGPDGAPRDEVPSSPTTHWRRPHHSTCPWEQIWNTARAVPNPFPKYCEISKFGGALSTTKGLSKLTE